MTEDSATTKPSLAETLGHETAPDLDAAEQEFAAASRELGDALSLALPKAEIAKLRRRRDKAGQKLDEAQLAANAEQRRGDQQAENMRRESRYWAINEAREHSSRLAEAADDFNTAIADAGRALATMREELPGLTAAAKRADTRLEIGPLSETLEARKLDELHSAGIHQLPSGGKPKDTLPSFAESVARQLREAQKAVEINPDLREQEAGDEPKAA